MADEKEKDGVTLQGETGEKKERGAQDAGGVEGDGKQAGRSKTELDVKELAIGELSQEDEGEEEEEGDTAKEAKDPAGWRGKRDYILILVSLLLILIVISGGVFVWTRYFASNEKLALSSSRGYEYELKPFFVPLAKAESSKFLRVNMIIELSDKKASKQIVKRIEEVRGSILNILINAAPKNIESSQGKEVLAEEIASTINLLLGEKIVNRIFFNEVLVV